MASSYKDFEYNVLPFINIINKNAYYKIINHSRSLHFEHVDDIIGSRQPAAIRKWLLHEPLLLTKKNIKICLLILSTYSAHWQSNKLDNVIIWYEKICVSMRENWYGLFKTIVKYRKHKFGGKKSSISKMGNAQTENDVAAISVVIFLGKIWC